MLRLKEGFKNFIDGMVEGFFMHTSGMDLLLTGLYIIAVLSFILVELVRL